MTSPRAAAFFAVLTTMYAARAAADAPLPFDDALTAVVDAPDAQLERTAKETEADARRAKAARAYDPTATAQGILGRFADFGDDQFTSRHGELDVGLNLYRFGADAAESDAANAALAAVRARNALDVGARETEAALALFAVIEAARNERISRELLSTKAASIELAKALYARGVKPHEDIERLELDRADDELRADESVRDRLSAEATVHRLATRAVTVAPEWPWETFLEGATAPRLAEATPRESRAVGAAQALSAAARADVASARAGNGPSLDLLGSAIADRRAEPGPPLERRWVGTVTLTVPLYDRAQNRGDIAAAAARQTAAEAQEHGLRLARDAQLGPARAAYLATLTLLKQRRDLARSARVLYEKTLVAYKRGALAVLDLTDDERRLASAESAAERALASAHRAAASLCGVLDRPLRACATP